MSSFIKKIYQIDRYQFAIEWTDGLLTEHRLSQLQENCPCIQCIEKKVKEKSSSEDEVMAYRIFSIGTYAIGIQFTSGCSRGIFPYSLLRRLGGVF